jgi:hypothetical protein
MRKLFAFLAVVATSALTSVASAAGEPNIPDMGVDMPGYIGALGTQLGTVIGAAVALTVAVVVVTMGVKWLKRAGH